MKNQNYEEFLHKIFSNVNEWLKLAEAKNFGLLSLNAAIVFGFSQINFLKNSPIEIAGYYIFAPFCVFSFIMSLISLFPILSKIEKNSYTKSWINKFSQLIDNEKQFENIWYYGYIRGLSLDKFENEIIQKTQSSEQFTPAEKELSVQILYNSRITWLKYQLFKIAAFSFLAGTIFFIIGLPIIKIFI